MPHTQSVDCLLTAFKVHDYPSVEMAIQHACEVGGDELIVAFGSFHVVEAVFSGYVEIDFAYSCKNRYA